MLQPNVAQTHFALAGALKMLGRDSLAIEQMRSMGATITSVESVLFQWLGSAEHPQFKAISRIVKEL